MGKIHFQNGPEAPPIVLPDELDDSLSDKDKKARLEELASLYGTVPEAAAWADGDKAPKHLSALDDIIPETSRLKEHVVSAPPAPEVQAKHDRAAQKLQEEHAASLQQAADEAAEAREAEAKAADKTSKSK